MIKRIVLVCTALAFGAFASPLAAQQAQPTPPAEQPMPAPAPEAAPPPLPPMPSARPSHRWVDIDGHRARSAHQSAKRTRHAAKLAKHRTIHARHAAATHRAPERPSSRTIRRCHSLSYSQIMRSSQCRALMKQELAGADKRQHHARDRHRAAAHRHAATRRNHHTATRKRR